MIRCLLVAIVLLAIGPTASAASQPRPVVEIFVEILMATTTATSTADKTKLEEVLSREKPAGHVKSLARAIRDITNGQIRSSDRNQLQQLANRPHVPSPIKTITDATLRFNNGLTAQDQAALTALLNIEPQKL